MIKRTKQKLYNLLRWSEKWTQIDNVYYFKNSFWTITGYISSIIKGLLISILLVNLLPRDTFGYYKYILSIIGVSGIFALTGMGAAISQALARDKDGMFFYITKIVLKWSTLGSFSLLFVAFYYYTKHNLQFTYSFIFLAIIFPFYSISGYYNQILSSKKKFDVQTKVFVIQSIFSSIIIVLTIILTKDLFWIILATILSTTISGIPITLYSAKKYLKNDELDLDNKKYGYELSAIGIIDLIAQNIDKLILPILLGYQELAIYSTAIMIPEQVKSLFKSIVSLTFPKFVKRGENKELRRKIILTNKKFLILISLIVIIYWFSADFVFKIIFPKYLDAVIYSKIFSISLLAFPTALIISYLSANKKSKIILQQNLFYSITKIFLTIILTYTYGLWGLISATLITRISTFLFLNIIFKKIN